MMHAGFFYLDPKILNFKRETKKWTASKNTQRHLSKANLRHWNKSQNIKASGSLTFWVLEKVRNNCHQNKNYGQNRPSIKSCLLPNSFEEYN